MIEKVTISRIGHLEKDKEGNPLRTKDNKPYTRCLIDLTDGRKVSGFGNQTTRTWKEGDDLDLDLEQKGQYWNFKTIKKDNLSSEQLDRIEKMLTELHKHLITTPNEDNF